MTGFEPRSSDIQSDRAVNLCKVPYFISTVCTLILQYFLVEKLSDTF